MANLNTRTKRKEFAKEVSRNRAIKRTYDKLNRTNQEIDTKEISDMERNAYKEKIYQEIDSRKISVHETDTFKEKNKLDAILTNDVVDGMIKQKEKDAITNDYVDGLIREEKKAAVKKSMRKAYRGQFIFA